MWTPRGRRPVQRFFAHLPIRLPVVTPLPVEGQAWVIAFPFSLGWSFGGEAKTPAGGGAGVETPISAPHDPQGNVTTFERSQYENPATGETAIGPGGGTVKGAGGVELRIPSGAVEKGVELKVEGLSAETLLQQFPGQVPDLGRDADDKPLAKLAGGIRITSKDEPTFTKPIDLAFPLPDFTKAPEAERPPSGKPEEAYFYVVRRLEGPCEDGGSSCAAADRKVLFQTIDHAFAECPEAKPTCEASEKKVVTASWPFSGYVDSFGGFSFLGSGLLIQPVAVAYAYLMWTYDQALPGKALAGVVTGKVLRTKWNPGATTLQYEGVAGAFVTAVDASGQRLLQGNEPAARTDGQGTFTLWDPRYVGGTVRVAATLSRADVTTLCPPGEGGDATFRCGIAYEADPADWKTSGLRFHRNIATVNLTFPSVEPPLPPPAIGVTVYRAVDGKDTGGIVPTGTPLILAIKPSSRAVEVREVLVQGGTESFRSDPVTREATVEYTPQTVGTYRVEVTGLGASAAGLPEAVKGGTTFRVIGAGGTDEIVEGARPEVIPASTVPKSGASGVQISTYVQVVFTEPVRKVSGNVFLRKVLPSPPTPPPLSDPIEVKLSGVLRNGGVVEDLAASPDAVITSLTVQPLSGLEYGATYRLELGDGIEDLDTTPCGPAPNQPPPCSLVPYSTQFTTFTPESLSTNPESFGSPGIVVLGERAYLVQNHFYAGTLRVFEATDPVSPLEIPNSASDTRDPRYMVSYRPVDLVGESDSPLTGGRVVAVVTGPTAQSKPSNVWVLDVNDDTKTQWIGAVSLTSSAAEGFVSRTFLRAGVLYAATFRKGIQVVDLGTVKDAFKPVETDATGHFQMRQAFLTDGQGYGQENVVGIPVSSPFGGPARLNDIEAALTQTADGAQVLVAAPGDPGLTVVNPNTQSVLWNDKVTVERGVAGQKVVEATLRYGQAIALGNVAGQDLAVVVGTGTIAQDSQSRPLLMVVSLYDPQNPVGLGYVLLDDATVGDVILKDDLALLGGSKQVTLLSLTDPARPKVLGTVPNLGGRLAIGDNGILFGSAYSPFGGNNPLGGVRTAALGAGAFITKVAPDPIVVDLEGFVLEDPTFDLRVVPPMTTNWSDIDVYKGSNRFGGVHVPLENGHGTREWLIQDPFDPGASYTATPDVRDPENNLVPPYTRKLGVTRLPLAAETRDRQLEVRFALPAESTKRYSLRVYVASGTSSLPANPTLVLPWSAIQSAYERDEDVFEDFSSTSLKSREPYVIRKIERVTIPGMPLIKQQQAFVLDAVFGGYNRYRVSLVEEGQNPREYARVEGEAAYNAQWAEVLDGLAAGAAASAGFYQPSDRVRLASSLPLFAMQIPPEQALDWMLYSSGISRVTLPIKKAVGFTKDAWGNVIQPSFPAQYLIGLYSGFLDGIVGDWHVIRHPLDTLKSIGEAVSGFCNLVKNSFEADGWLVGAWRSIWTASGQFDSFTPLQFLDAQNRFLGKVGYVWGYLAGMVLWQVVAFIGLAAVTEGIGAIVEKAVALVKAGATAINLSGKVARMLATLGRLADIVAKHAKLGEAAEDMTRLWTVMKELADGPLTTVALKYRNFTKTLEPALARMAVAANHGKSIVEAFSRVASMPDEVALRLLQYMAQGEGKTAKVAAWLTKHTARNITEAGVASNRAIKEAAEAAGEALNSMPEEALEVLVLAADAINLGDGLAARNLVRTFADKYRALPAGEGLMDVLTLLRTSAADTRYSDAVLARAVRVHAQVPAPFSPQAVEGSARLLRDGGSPLDEIENLSRSLMEESSENADTLLRTLRVADDPRSVQGFAEAMRGIPCVLP